MTTIIITASRALLDTENSRKWFAYKIRKMGSLCSVPITFRTGDAKSDKFVIKTFKQFYTGFTLVIYDLKGGITITNEYENKLISSSCWITPEELETIRKLNYKRIPLKRDEALIDDSTIEDTKCVGFVAPWSKTNGTIYTLRLAAQRGIECLRRDCPKEYGP